ncbi:HAD family hydrolase [Bowdeniella nasicola]|uniref:HAD family hydrolase n=1 Tax=Bowdeniella nasicola TaxID=208480 RepID=UPI0013011934|nr:HAD family phosphatase [Bowdeniella nasicola]
MTRSLSTLIFDLGNVVITWDPRPALPEQYTGQDAEDLLTRLDFFTRNADHDAGKPFAEWVADLRSSGDAEGADALQHYVDHFDRSLVGLVRGTSQLIDDLKAAGVTLYALTNWSAETFHHAQAAAPALAQFDDILVSGEEGIAKPNPEIYTRALERWDLDVRTTGFLDDSEANIAGAESVGLTTHLFTNAVDARAWARDMTGAAGV